MLVAPFRPLCLADPAMVRLAVQARRSPAQHHGVRWIWVFRDAGSSFGMCIVWDAYIVGLLRPVGGVQKAVHKTSAGSYAAPEAGIIFCRRQSLQLKHRLVVRRSSPDQVR